MVQMNAVDAYFIWSHFLVRRSQAVGSHAIYLPFAYDPQLHHPMTLTQEDAEAYRAEVAFVGNVDPERERWLAALQGCDLAVWGVVRPKSSAFVRAAWRGRAVVGTEMVKAALGASISLNILRTQNKDACNMRTFELPGSGAFMLHERSTDLGNLFVPGKECDDFGTYEELRAKVRYYLDHPAERGAIAAAGHLAALRQTYKEWAARVISVYDQVHRVGRPTGGRRIRNFVMSAPD